jgi:hypothetical protein
LIKHKATTFIRRAIKSVLWILAGILGLVILAVVALRFPGIQHYLAQQAVSAIAEKTHSRIEVGSVRIAFTHSIVLQDIFIESRQRDTLLSIGTLAADVNLLGLFAHEIALTHLRIDSLTAHITRTLPDSSFNFAFLRNALSPETPADMRPGTSSGPGWNVELGGLSLTGIHVTYNDEVGGMNLGLHIGNLEASIDTCDLAGKRFHVDALSLANTSASVIQTKESPHDTLQSTEVAFGIRSIALAHLHLKYDNTVSGERYRVDIGTSTLLAENVDLPSHHIALNTFQLDSSTIVAVVPTTREATPAPSHATVLPWTVSLDHLMLSGNCMQYDVQGTAPTKGVDLNHLRFDSLTVFAENIYFSDNRITADINHTLFREHSGLEVRELSGGIYLDSLHAQLTDFTVATAASRIRQSIWLSYPSLSALRRLPGTVHVKAIVGDSHIAVSDLLLFQPSLPLQNRPDATIGFSCQLSGLVRDLRVELLRFAAGDSTVIELTGSIRGLPNAETAYYDVHLLRFSSGRNDIRSFLPDTLVPKQLVFPAAVSMNGNFNGTMTAFTASSVITTSIGRLKGSVAVHPGTGHSSAASRWTTDVAVDEFDVGALLNTPEILGLVSLQASAAGTGFRKDDIEAALNVEVDKAVVNGYPYRRISLHGTAGPQMFTGTAEIRDSNIACTFSGTLNAGEADPACRFTFDVQGADLQRLHLTADDIRVAGMITAELTGQNVNDINGTIDARHITIIKNRHRYLIDSLLFASVNNERETHLSVESTLLAAKCDGTVRLGDLTTTLRKHFTRYFPLHDSTAESAPKGQTCTFRIALRDPRMLTEVFFPQLERLTAGTIEGDYDSTTMMLNVNINIPTVTCNSVDLDSLSLKITSDPQRLQSTLRIGSIADTMLHLRNLQISADVGHDSISVALQSTGDHGDTTLFLAGVCSSLQNGYQFRLRPDGIVFQNTRWSVPADNYVIFGSHQFIAHNVVLRDGMQSLSLNTADGTTRHAPLRMTFADFDLATLSRVVERDSGLVRGVLNGNVVLSTLDTGMAFTSDITVNQFTVLQRLVGDIVLRANTHIANIYDLSMDIAGNDNNIAMRGQYRSKQGGSELDISLDFKTLNLASIEPLTFGAVRRLSGTMSGALQLHGTIMKPSVAGRLKFTNAVFDPAILGSLLRLDNGQITCDATGIHFGSLELSDTLGNKAILSGNLFTEDFRAFRYDCRLHTEHFLVMNATASRDASYYGTVFLGSDIFVSGDHVKPIIRVQAQLDKGTDVAIVLPESETEIQERLGIVRFVDLRHPQNPIMSRSTAATDRTRDTTGIRHVAMDLTANVEVKKEARLRILIDPTNGDSLVIRGEATFSVGVDPSGKLAVTGRYEILDGSYQLSFGQFIRREFAIDKGSSLTWLGSVTDANVDIKAIYTAKTSAFDLVQDQLTGLSQEERNKYKQELRIQVYLIMDGRLLAPNIHFRLDLPPDQRGALGGSIYAKLNELNGQESELNKQVFALLVLGRFISSNPLASATEGAGLAGLARSSVSQILTEQLNRLSEKVITGVSLNVGVESYQDYSSGSAEGRTQLQLALTKQLFDERVTVQVGGNVDLEGQRSQQNALNNFAGDIKVAYKLTEDGRWQLQVFRQNTNGGAIEGDLVETGVGIVFTIDYDKLFGFTLAPVPDNAKQQ